MKKIETFLPLFTGFYNTMWEFDHDNVYNEEGTETLDTDSYDVDYESYQLSMVKHIAWRLEVELSDFISKIKVQKIVSPKYYNYSNDSVDVEIEVDTKAVAKYLYENETLFNDYLKSRYTSCDGFSSAYSNSFEAWEEETNNFTKLDDDGHRLGAILDFICENEEVDVWDIRQSWNENNSEDNYITINVKDVEDLDIVQLDDVFSENIEDMDLNYGYVKLEVEDAKAKAELFGGYWKDYLTKETKMSLLKSVGLGKTLTKNL